VAQFRRFSKTPLNIRHCHSSQYGGILNSWSAMLLMWASSLYLTTPRAPSPLLSQFAGELMCRLILILTKFICTL
jgi:hypothetical protein